MKPFKTLSKPSETEMTERRSVFLGYASPVTTEDEALEFIAKIKKRHSDATHNVYAYILRGSISRFSDDGEPHGTAGLPVLEVLRKEDVTDAVIVVTRYFGGILLGAGGLVRAYSASAKLALDAAVVKECKPFVRFGITCGYGEYQKLGRIFELNGVKNAETEYGEGVCVTACCPEERYDALCVAVRDATGGKAMPERKDVVYA